MQEDGIGPVIDVSGVGFAIAVHVMWVIFVVILVRIVVVMIIERKPVGIGGIMRGKGSIESK